jgi:hypothetical protein
MRASFATRTAFAWSAPALVAVACALPKYDIDPTLDATGNTGGTGGSGGASGTGGRTGTGGSGATGGSVGPGGAGQGDARELACGEYCMTYQMNCRNSPADTYDDFGDCLDTCFNSDWPLGEDAAQVNSVQCRLLHAHLAENMPDPHCFHSAEFPSKTICAPPAQ